MITLKLLKAKMIKSTRKEINLKILIGERENEDSLIEKENEGT